MSYSYSVCAIPWFLNGAEWMMMMMMTMMMMMMTMMMILIKATKNRSSTKTTRQSNTKPPHRGLQGRPKRGLQRRQTFLHLTCELGCGYLRKEKEKSCLFGSIVGASVLWFGDLWAGQSYINGSPLGFIQHHSEVQSLDLCAVPTFL